MAQIGLFSYDLLWLMEFYETSMWDWRRVGDHNLQKFQNDRLSGLGWGREDKQTNGGDQHTCQKKYYFCQVTNGPKCNTLSESFGEGNDMHNVCFSFAIVQRKERKVYQCTCKQNDKIISGYLTLSFLSFI